MFPTNMNASISVTAEVVIEISVTITETIDKTLSPSAVTAIKIEATPEIRLSAHNMTNKVLIHVFIAILYNKFAT